MPRKEVLLGCPKACAKEARAFSRYRSPVIGRRKGFTIIEVAIVASIIGLLAAIATPAS